MSRDITYHRVREYKTNDGKALALSLRRYSESGNVEKK